eukprot:1301871-Amphidinium_carterae.2
MLREACRAAGLCLGTLSPKSLPCGSHPLVWFLFGPRCVWGPSCGSVLSLLAVCFAVVAFLCGGSLCLAAWWDVFIICLGGVELSLPGPLGCHIVSGTYMVGFALHVLSVAGCLIRVCFFTSALLGCLMVSW